MNTNKQIEDGEKLNDAEGTVICLGGIACIWGFAASMFTPAFPIALMLTGAWFVKFGWDAHERRIAARKGGV